MLDSGLGTRIVNVAWWLEENEDRAGTMLSQIVRQIRDRHSWRYDADVLHAGLYAGNANAGGVIMTPGGDFTYSPSTKPRNVCRMAVDTAQSKVAKHRPLPVCQTSKGNYRDQKRARKMSQFIEGMFYHTKYYERFAPLQVRDAGVFGRGIVKVVRRGKAKVGLERVFPWEFFVDEWDGRYGEPRNMYQIRTLDFGRAMALFGKQEEDESDEDHAKRVRAIEQAATSTPSDEWTWEGEADTTVNRVRLVEAYHLCDEIDAHDDDEKHECTGRHCIAILGGESKALVHEPFDWPEFPFAVLNYSEPLAGYMGMGLCEMLEGWQEAIDTAHETLEECTRTAGGAIIIADNNCDVAESKFQNGGILILRKKPGSTIQAITPAPAHQMIFQRDREMPQDALGEMGFSPASTQGIKQPGLTAAVAINAMDEIEDERRLPFGRAYEVCNLDVARKGLLVVRDIARDKDAGEMVVDVPMKKGLLPIKWSDVKLDKFQLRVFSGSNLPQQLSARLEYLNYLFDRQLIDRQMFIQQLGGPDVVWELDLETADRLNIDEKLEAVCDAETPEELAYAMQIAVPSNYQDPSWYQKRAQQRYNDGQTQGLEQPNLEALQSLMAAADTIIKTNAGAPPAPPTMATAGTPASPDMGMGAPAGMPPMPPPGAGPPGPMMNGAPPPPPPGM